jgi:HD-GYP domain-containing protein (c-di-GMP phosphodiesterase class II)/CheY-like chemotaxis protein
LNGAGHDKPVVLCCDDDEAILDVCHRALKSRFEVVTVQSGLEVLGACRRKKPSLILLDILMPPPNGLIVLGMVRTDPELREIPVVMLTADGRIATVKKALAQGAAGFILKPVHPVGLFAKVSGYLEAALAAKQRDRNVAEAVSEAGRREASMSEEPAVHSDLQHRAGDPDMLGTFQAMDAQLSGDETVQDALMTCLDFFLRILSTERGALLINDYPGDTYRLGAVAGCSDTEMLEFFKRHHQEIVRSLKNSGNEAVHFRFAEEREPWTAAGLCVRGTLVGFFLLPAPESIWPTDHGRRSALALYLRMASSEIHMWQLIESARRGMVGIARAFSASLDAKDPYTQGHSERVTLYALALNSMAYRHLPEYHIPTAGVRLAGLLHDVGKIGIHDAILGKPEKLTSDEFETMKTHATLGRRMLATVPELSLAMDGMAHHERFDGKGYPEGLVGESIPLVGRFLAVADAFDAMTSSRPYRKGLDLAVAVDEIRRNAGGQFDPLVVELFEHAHAEGLIAAVYHMNFRSETGAEASLGGEETPATVVDSEKEALFGELFARFDSVNLGSPASREVIALLADPMVTIEKVARRIEGDTALTARILQVANSSFYGFSRKIASVEQGIIVLGLRQLRHLLYAINIRDLHSAHGRHLELGPYWKHAFSVGIIARAIASHVEQQHLPESAFLAGLMHDIGKVVLLLLHPDRYARVLRRVNSEGMTCREAEKEEFGLSHEETAPFLVSRWNLPVFLLDPILRHHQEELDPKNHALACIVKAADALSYQLAPGILRGPPPEPENLESLLASISPSLLPTDRLHRFLAETVASYEDALPFSDTVSEKD